MRREAWSAPWLCSYSAAYWCSTPDYASASPHPLTPSPFRRGGTGTCVPVVDRGQAQRDARGRRGLEEKRHRIEGDYDHISRSFAATLTPEPITESCRWPFSPPPLAAFSNSPSK